MRKFILNNTVFSNFARIGQVELIKLALNQVYTSAYVHEEILNGIAKGYNFLKSINSQTSFENEEGWIKVIPSMEKKEYILMLRIAEKIKLGEASCIAIACQRKMVFVSDDWKARELAKERGVSISGTLGILKECIDKNILSLKQGNEVLGRMIINGYYSPISNLEELKEE